MGYQRRQTLVLSPRPLIIDLDIPTLDIASFVQAVEGRCDDLPGSLGRPAVEIPDHRHRRLLRPCRERPRCRAAEQGDEPAAVHSITSSARARTEDGISSPSAFAVLRLMISSYLVDAWTGRSAGLSPLRMRSTYPAAPPYWSGGSAPLGD